MTHVVNKPSLYDELYVAGDDVNCMADCIGTGHSAENIIVPPPDRDSSSFGCLMARYQLYIELVLVLTVAENLSSEHELPFEIKNYRVQLLQHAGLIDLILAASYNE